MLVKSKEDTIILQYAGASITIGVGTVAMFVTSILNYVKEWGISPGIIIVAGLMWLFFIWSRSVNSRFAKMEEISKMHWTGSVHRFNDRTSWYNAISISIKNAPSKSHVYDTTCGPRRANDKPLSLETAARNEYKKAISERNDISIHEIYSSNWEPEVRELLKNKPSAIVRVIPCSSPQFLFTDFLVVYDRDVKGICDVFLSGLEFPGGEINLWIKDKDAADFFVGFFDILYSGARKVSLEQGRTMIEKANHQLRSLDDTVNCNN